MLQDMGGVDQALYNINASGQAVNVLGDSQDLHQNLHMQDNQGERGHSKVAAIAQKIRELTENT